MTEKEKILRAWERCDECHKHPAGMSEAYVECEYTMWFYCRQDELIRDTVELIKKTPEIVRCGDCVNRRVCVIAKKHDGFTDNKFDPNWFCADGERENDG